MLVQFPIQQRWNHHRMAKTGHRKQLRRALQNSDENCVQNIHAPSARLAGEASRINGGGEQAGFSDGVDLHLVAAEIGYNLGICVLRLHRTGD